MNILGANSYEEGTTLLCTWSTMDKNQGFRPADHPRSATKVQKKVSETVIHPPCKQQTTPLFVCTSR